jgi:hypothetical protein
MHLGENLGRTGNRGHGPVGAGPAELMREPAVQAALDAAQRNEPHFLNEQSPGLRDPAPPFKEELRGTELEQLFKSLGLADVRNG